MKTKLLDLVVLLTVVLALFVPQSALAQSGGGAGTLTASGNGLAGIRGDGTVTVSGNGILWIRDHAGDASVNVSGSGEKRELPNGWIQYIGFQGQATVSGSWLTVALSGYDIHLQASGAGKYILRGNGTYSVERDGLIVVSGAWTEDAEVMTVP